MSYLCSKIISITDNNCNMKHVLVLFFAIVLTCSSAMAQSEFFRWGVTAGGNISKVDGEGDGFMKTGWNFDSSGGYFAGLSAKVDLPLSGLGLDASLLYSQEMVDLRTAGNIYTDKLRYFSIPLHARYDFEIPVLSRLAVPYAFAGPQVNLALNDFDWYRLFRQDPEMSNKDIDDVEENYTKKQVWKMDLGFGVLVVNHIQVAYTYSVPLESSFRFKTVYEDTSSHFKMGTHRIGLTYFF